MRAVVVPAVLTCSIWNGVRTCTGPDGYVSHETEWQGMTNGWDNRGDSWATSTWIDRETTTVERPQR